MRTVQLRGTGVTIGAVGLGCAGLFRIPNPKVRRRTLDKAIDLGIRHFDVAPMYGLGIAESELGSLIRRRRDSVTITTKFGIAVTPLGRIAGCLQAPARSLLSGHRSLGATVQSSGSSPTAGTVGKLLYRQLRFTAGQAKEGLESSLRALRTDYIDAFVLHQPPFEYGLLDPELVTFLEQQKDRGKIRAWGVAGDYADDTSALLDVFGDAPLLQIRDDALSTEKSPLVAPDRAIITFGALGRPLALLKRFFDSYPAEVPVWSETMGMDTTIDNNMCSVLVELALLRNPGGPVLVSTSNIGHVETLAALANAPSAAAQPRVLSDFVQLLSSAYERLAVQGAVA